MCVFVPDLVAFDRLAISVMRQRQRDGQMSRKVRKPAGLPASTTTDDDING